MTKHSPRPMTLAALALSLVLSACGIVASAPTPTPTPFTIAPQRGEAVVESVDIVMLESFPVQVRVVAKGYLPDGCTTIDQVTRTRTDNHFEVKIITVRPAEAACTLALVPFEESIPLDVVGLKAGIYLVTVNGLSNNFELSTDNVLP